MARITIEDALEKAKNRFALVHLTSNRARQLLKGAKPLVDTRNNREIVVALREIAAGRVTYAYPEYLVDAKVNYRHVEEDYTEFIGEYDESE